MWKKIISTLLIVEILIAWPLSIVKKPINWNSKTIFDQPSYQEEYAFSKKLALDTSKIKKIYYNKLTIVKDRYWKNFLVQLDLNNYFFVMHPREDVSGVNHRFKYPFWAILFLVVAIKSTIEKNKFKVWKLILLFSLVLAIIKQSDGWDLMMYGPTSYLLCLGGQRNQKIQIF